MHPLDQYVFVVAAVEDHHFALRRGLLVNAPQKIVVHLLFRRLFPSDRAQPEGVAGTEHVAHGTVLTAGIHPLQDDQDGVLALGDELLVQLRDPFGAFGGFLPGGFLVEFLRGGGGDGVKVDHG